MTDVRVGRLAPRRVIVAEKRGQRPSDWVRRDEEKPDQDCPFCVGHEAETPPEVWAMRPDSAPDQPGWQIRVIPNKYPIMAPHELIIETPHHDADLPDLSLSEAESVLQAYRERMRTISYEEGVVYPALFKNVGRAAGASRAHLHSQLLGLAFVPPAVEAERAMAATHRDRTGGCLHCDVIDEEIARGDRVIWADDRYLVWSPQAAMAPYECWILPRTHAASFLDSDDDALNAFAQVLARSLRALYGVFEGPFAYNYFLHTAPLHGSSEADGVHWHLEILPRLGTPAGLEWGSGVFVNAVPPERAAAQLGHRFDAD